MKKIGNLFKLKPQLSRCIVNSSDIIDIVHSGKILKYKSFNDFHKIQQDLYESNFEHSYIFNRALDDIKCKMSKYEITDTEYITFVDAKKAIISVQNVSKFPKNFEKNYNLSILIGAQTYGARELTAGDLFLIFSLGGSAALGLACIVGIK